MDYKYISQLLERYWECQTTLEEEAILRAFFSQDDIPASLLPYRDLFVYELTETKEDTLGDDFDARMLSLIGKETPVKARRISIAQRMRPLFRAAAVVAIVLSLANAIQMSFNYKSGHNNSAAIEHVNHTGVNVAKFDSVTVDSMRKSSLSKDEMESTVQSDNMDDKAFIMK